MAEAAERTSGYPPISHYGLISDCDNVALVSLDGSIDWCCMPRVDADSLFGRILDWRRGGHFTITPAAADVARRRYYEPGTLVLVNHFRTAEGEVRLTDFFVRGSDALSERDQLCRLVEGVSGAVELEIDIAPRFDYGEVIPFIQEVRGDAIALGAASARSETAGRGYTAIGSNKAVVICSDTPLDVREGRLYGRVTVTAGTRIGIGMRFTAPSALETPPDLSRYTVDIGAELEHTLRWWRKWSDRIPDASRNDPLTVASALVLKGLTYEPSGAVAAAATTSLPEWIGGHRNWDYRYSWIRDAAFTVRALYQLGFSREGDRFRNFVKRSCAGNARQVQIMYAVDGKRRLHEFELPWLEGYRGSRPARVGNAAYSQTQLDVYGELLELAWLGADTVERDSRYWQFLTHVIELVCERWREPDHGIWEVRNQRRHFVYSKALSWVALDRGLRLARRNELGSPVDHWREVRDAIRSAIDEHGYDARRGVFVQAFDTLDLDAALLRLPQVGYVDYRDPRMMRTVHAIREELASDGLIFRYRSDDGVGGEEGAFISCTFWLVNCLAHMGEAALARYYYDQAAACANDLGLFPEEVHPRDHSALGNFPQALTHVAQINAGLALRRCAEGPRD